MKIHLKTVDTFNRLSGQCGSVSPGPASAEFTGSGTYNGASASFRVCVSDAGEPGSGSGAAADLFHLECTAGCSYTTTNRVADEQLDGGNIQVHNPSPAGAPSTAGASTTSSDETGTDHAASEPTASTLILDPVLLSEANRLDPAVDSASFR